MNIEEMTRLSKNAVVTLHRGDETHTLYLKPGAYLEAHCSTYTNEGWEVFSVLFCTVEVFLNCCMNDVVESINDLYSERKQLRDQFRSQELNLDAYTSALNVISELEMTDLRRLYRLMNQIHFCGCDCYNEEAIGLYHLVF